MTLTRILAVVLTLVFFNLSFAQPNYTKITYLHPDGLGNTGAASDEQGNLLWRVEYYPFGAEYSNTEVGREGTVTFAGKACYEDLGGICYFGGRWYSPDIGRFMSIDPAPVIPEDWRTFNRYAYGFNNPYRYIDPDGHFPLAIPIVVAGGLFTQSNKANAPTHGTVVTPDTLDPLAFAPGGGQAKAAVAAGVIVKANGKKVIPNAAQSANLKRFQKKIPANAKNNVTTRNLPNEGIAVQATSYGKVPGSKAVYEKQINSAGKTIQATKTTYDPKGNIVHVKDKLKGKTFRNE